MTTLSIASGGRGHVALRKHLEHLNRKHKFTALVRAEYTYSCAVGCFITLVAATERYF